MTFSNVKSPGWTVGDSLTAGQLNQIQYNMIKSLDIDNPTIADQSNSVVSNNSFSGTNAFTGPLTIPSMNTTAAIQSIENPIHGQIVRWVGPVAGKGHSNIYFEYDANDTGTGTSFYNLYYYRSTTAAGTWKPFNCMITPKTMNTSGIVVHSTTTTFGWTIGVPSTSGNIDTNLSIPFNNTKWSNSGLYAGDVGAIAMPKAMYGGYVFDINFLYPYQIQMSVGGSPSVDTMFGFFIAVYNYNTSTTYPGSIYPIIIPKNTPQYNTDETTSKGTLAIHEKIQVQAFDPAVDDQFQIQLYMTQYNFTSRPYILSMKDSTGYSGVAYFKSNLSVSVTAY